MLVMGLFGLFMNTFGIPIAPLVIGFVLAPKLEQSLRQALILSDGGYSIFLTRPIALFFLCLAVFSLWQILRMSRKAA